MDGILVEKQEPPRHSLNVPQCEEQRRRSQSTISDSSFRRAKNAWRKGRRFPTDPSLRTASPNPEPRPQPRDARLQCDADAILDKILSLDREKSSYPQFDSICAYVRYADSIPALLRNEARRLMSIAEDPDAPLGFSSNGYLQSDTEEGYRAMSNICQRILTALTICLLDNECINAKHCARMTNQIKLSNYINQVYKAQNVATESTNRRYLPATFALVDYISAVLTRLIIQTSPGRYWQLNVMSVLVQRITKIKVLLVDLQLNASVAARSADAVLMEVRESGELRETSNGLDEEEECEEYMRNIEANEKDGTASYEEKEVAKYCVEQNKFRFGLNSAVRMILTSMRFINSSGMPPTSFEIFAVAYETGFEGFKALLYQDRDLEYSATSDLDNMNVAHSAFNLLNQTAMHIKQAEDLCAHKSRSDAESLSTKLEWTYIGSESDPLYAQSNDLKEPRNYLSLSSMDQVVTIMVLLATTCPIFLAHWTGFRHVIALTGFIRDDAQPLEEGQFKSFFRMYTAQFDDDIDRRDVLHLSEALREGFFSRSQLMPHPALGSTTDESALNKLDKLTKNMEDWVIDETRVTVRCDRYVIIVMLIAVLCVIGGLAIGFSVGERIHGVDPSNLATYLWVLAAFIILFAKSMHVSEWTWNDFLHMRARCCSVSELESITGVDGQLIIAKLLHDQHRGSVLRIRGPYNSAFLQRSSDGFSIDEPIHTSTLLLSGLTMLKVVTARGHALVCLDFRRGTDLEIIGHTPSLEKDYLICDQIDRIQPSARLRDGGSGKPNLQVKHTFTRSQYLKWKRVQGIYKDKDARFS